MRGKVIMKTMQNKKKLIAAIVCGVLAIIALLFVYCHFAPGAAQGEKAYTLEVIDDKGQEKDYKGRTDAEYLSGILDELQDEGDFSYSGSQSSYGLYIDKVNGVTADYSKDGAYWAIKVNGEMGQYGADQQPVTDGDDYQLVYTK
jgi:hypothetical protein